MGSDADGVFMAHWKRRSLAFLAVARAAKPKIPKHLFEQAIVLWCRGCPSSYQEWVHGELDMPKVSLNSGCCIDPKDLLATFSKRIQRHEVAVFLLEDAAVLAYEYKKAGGRPIMHQLSRSSLPRPELYYYLGLFDIVNQAVIESGPTNRKAFFESYCQLFRTYLSIHPSVADLFESHAQRLKKADATAIVDTGMQGTFAFALAAAVKSVTGVTLEVCLAVAYPWLQPIFGDAPVSYDADALVALERMSRHEAILPWRREKSD